MKTIKHSLHFETVLDESDPTAQQLFALPKKEQVRLLENMLHELLAPQLKPIIDQLNDGNTYATLKLVS